MFYISLMVTTKHKSMLDSQKIEKSKLNTTTMENQVTKEGSKRGRKEKEKK